MGLWRVKINRVPFFQTERTCDTVNVCGQPWALAGSLLRVSPWQGLGHGSGPPAWEPELVLGQLTLADYCLPWVGMGYQAESCGL